MAISYEDWQAKEDARQEQLSKLARKISRFKPKTKVKLPKLNKDGSKKS